MTKKQSGCFFGTLCRLHHVRQSAPSLPLAGEGKTTFTEWLLTSRLTKIY